ncbi:MAG TPA: hypothetical protein VD884_10925 [Ohtaekwangia sp.]|nr:hypothetical protein [Ohtaekwangia sp.]
MSSCSQKPKALRPNEYLKWVAAEENGLVITKVINAVTLNARYLPADYLAYHEFKNSTADSFDSLVASYNCGLTFQFNIYADKTNKNYSNLMYYGLRNEQELSARTRILSFNISDFIMLEHDDKIYYPELSQFEGYDAIRNRLSFQMVFSVDEFDCGLDLSSFQDVTLIFEDPYWDVGVNYFEFEKNSFTGLPKIKF